MTSLSLLAGRTIGGLFRCCVFLNLSTDGRERVKTLLCVVDVVVTFLNIS